MGLGGNVENLITMPNSQTKIRLTRGLFTTYRADGLYPESELIENNGVKPDIHRALTVADFRAGFVEFVDAFSGVAVALTNE